MKRLYNPRYGAFWLAWGALVACGDDAADGVRSTGDAGSSSAADAGEQGGDASGAANALTYRSAVTPITRVDQAQPGTFIPPYEDCRAPMAGDSATRADGKVCTQVAISGCTEPGKYFPAYAACDVVRRQRPYWPAPAARASRSDDPRLSDPKFVAESAWASAQIGASGCSCCHDGRVIAPSQWDISLGPLWIDSLSDTGLALFAGFADSSVLGAYPKEANHGFDREQTGIPTTDTARMKAFVMAELSRRGLSEAWARAVPPFGGPIYTNSIKPPDVCTAEQGVATDGLVHWTGGSARYVYVLELGSKNPGVPPNLDLPKGTLWRLDVLASQPALGSGVRFGTTPAGSFQVYPESSPAAPLERGKRYQLVVLRDVGLPLVNCSFEFGREVVPSASADASTPLLDAGNGYPSADAASVADAGASADASSAADATAGMCSLPGGDAKGFGATCSDTTGHSDCPCAANYCSKSPFDAKGYCSVSGCKENPGICPAGWSCFDVSVFAPGQPSVCMRP